jgi:hypothetical protein
MQTILNKRFWGGLIGGFLVVCTLGAMAVTGGAAAAPASEGDQETPGSPGNSEQSSGAANPGSFLGMWTPTPDIAGIGLRVVDPPANAWVQIQWSNWSTSNWYPVDAWSGPLSQNDNGYGAVWFEPKDYGTGPFRWVVFDRNPATGGQVWAISDTFYLGWSGTLTILDITKGENLSQGATLSHAVSTLVPGQSLPFYSSTGVQLKANPAGCGQYAIGGEVLSASGRPVSDYRLRLTYPSGRTEIVSAGGAPDYGKSGFGYLLGTHRAGQTYKLELLPQGQDQPVAPPVTIAFSDSCSANYAWVVFQSRR